MHDDILKYIDVYWYELEAVIIKSCYLRFHLYEVKNVLFSEMCPKVYYWKPICVCTVNISCKGNLNLKSLISFEVTTKTLKGTNNRNDGSVAFVIIYREQN